MTYLVLCLPFLVASVVVAAIAWRRAPRGHAVALAVAGGALVVLTVVFDTLMIAAGLFEYGAAQISGLRLGLAPVEDLAYPIAGLLLLSAVWNLLAPRDAPTDAPEASAAIPEEVTDRGIRHRPH
ncbi:lycopene cyclase domain-containing protein [Agromyces sp. MMS24-K17]|uniref:lycopene cyclase domain-containing protein n=1 Tax=Agromyces sp. MMS24-K17 TaxID=3372850 RepID=UPI00375470A2